MPGPVIRVIRVTCITVLGLLGPPPGQKVMYMYADSKCVEILRGVSGSLRNTHHCTIAIHVHVIAIEDSYVRKPEWIRFFSKMVYLRGVNTCNGEGRRTSDA